MMTSRMHVCIRNNEYDSHGDDIASEAKEMIGSGVVEYGMVMGRSPVPAFLRVTASV
jgi:hypothetical protein